MWFLWSIFHEHISESLLPVFSVFVHLPFFLSEMINIAMFDIDREKMQIETLIGANDVEAVEGK